ncbi:hypothetical protein K432DRAFT_448424, partial [Lepidopterella palustris CBS 459.81]
QDAQDARTTKYCQASLIIFNTGINKAHSTNDHSNSSPSTNASLSPPHRPLLSYSSQVPPPSPIFLPPPLSTHPRTPLSTVATLMPLHTCSSTSPPQARPPNVAWADTTSVTTQTGKAPAATLLLQLHPRQLRLDLQRRPGPGLHVLVP